MTSDVEFDIQLSIGYLSHDEEKLLSVYKDTFDIVILGDGSFEVVNNIISSMV
jgi:hypothetical protein